jgi:hypothetical protein
MWVLSARNPEIHTYKFLNTTKLFPVILKISLEFLFDNWQYYSPFISRPVKSFHRYKLPRIRIIILWVLPWKKDCETLV